MLLRWMLVESAPILPARCSGTILNRLHSRSTTTVIHRSPLYSSIVNPNNGLLTSERTTVHKLPRSSYSTGSIVVCIPHHYRHSYCSCTHGHSLRRSVIGFVHFLSANNVLFHTHVRNNSQENPQVTSKELTFGGKALKLLGLVSGLYSKNAVRDRAAKALYESCIDNIQYEDFFRACSLPDTFQSWFLIAHLHVWLCLVRLKREGREGELLIKLLVSTFWFDVEQRMKMMGISSFQIGPRSLRELVKEFYGLTLAYEEGLLSDDKTLASAIWRNLITNKQSDTDPIQLARMVDYVRRQVQYMDGLESEHLLQTGRIILLPFNKTPSTTPI